MGFCGKCKAFGLFCHNIGPYTHFGINILKIGQKLNVFIIFSKLGAFFGHFGGALGHHFT